MAKEKVRTLFLDIGGVLLNDGWARLTREKAFERFSLQVDRDEIVERHETNFDTYELGRMTFDDYLDNTVFYKKRNFGKQEFIDFLLQQSVALPGAIEYFTELKNKYGLKVIAVSNEARELNEYRIRTFQLDKLFDSFVSSCYIGMRKPDPLMYKMASDISFTPFNEAVYIDDRIIYIEYARSLGLPSLHYTGVDSAKQYFEKLGLK
jgi:putative hydrolase of the HAD superfamily